MTRQPIADGLKQRVAAALSTIPEGKRGALIVLADEQGARAHIAAKIGDRWKVAAGAGRTWTGELQGEVAVVGTW